jgi:hypothetical protein
MGIKKHIMLLDKTYLSSAWTYDASEVQVEVMATKGIYAMVRRKGCMPFVVEIKCLKEKGDAALPTEC